MEPEHQLFLIIPKNVFFTTIEEPIAKPVIEETFILLSQSISAYVDADQKHLAIYA